MLLPIRVILIIFYFVTACNSPRFLFIFWLIRMSFSKSTRLTALAVRKISSSAKSIDLTVDADGIATLSLNNKPVNALSFNFMKDLSTSLDDIEKENFKGVVLTSAIPNIFSAGVHLKEAYRPNVETLTSLISTLLDIWVKLFGSSFVTAAAVNGHSPAGGCLLAMSCEYRAMVAGNFTIGLNETAIGMTPSKYFIETMKYTIGSRHTEMALTTSKLFTPEEALKVGLVDALAGDKEECIEKCKNYIRKFDNIYPEARKAKKVIRGAVLNIILENRDGYLKENLKEVLDDRTQNLVGLYLKKLKERKSKGK